MGLPGRTKTAPTAMTTVPKPSITNSYEYVQPDQRADLPFSLKTCTAPEFGPDIGMTTTHPLPTGSIPHTVHVLGDHTCQQPTERSRHKRGRIEEGESLGQFVWLYR
jgi:hypothetical protein